MALCEVEDLELLLQMTLTEAQQPAALRAIDEATAAIQSYCRQDLEAKSDEEITLDVPAGCRKLFLPQLPVTAVSEVVEDGETLVEGDDYKLGQWGVLHRIGQDWAEGIQIVTVTYSHGYAAAHAKLAVARDVCARAAARRFQAGLRAAAQEGIPGIAALQLGDYSVRYAGEQAGGAGDSGVLGVSAAPILTKGEQEALAREYRL